MAFLHVISGPQSGASIELEENKQYKVSSDLNDSDIYLSSDQIFSFNIQINELGLTFSNIFGVDLKKVNNKELIQSEKLYLFTLEVFFLNHKITLSEKERLATEHLALSKSALFDNTDLDEDTPSIAQPDYTILQKLIILAGSVIGFSFSKYKSLKKRLGKAFYLLLALIGFSFVMVIISAFLVHNERQNNRIAEAQMNIMESKRAIQKIILNLPADTYSSITVNYERTRFVIKGVLPDNESLKYLKQSLHKIKNVSIVYHVLLFSAIKDITLAVCKENNIINPMVNINDNFGFTISILGTVNSLDDVNNAEIELHGKFNELQQIDTSKVYVISDIQNYWNNLPTDIQQQITINYNLQDGIINLTGVLSKDQLVTLQQYISTFNVKYTPVIKVISKVRDVVNTLPFGVKEVFVGNISWIVTNDGSVIYPGGSYKGVTVAAITARSITFRTSFVFTVPVNELIEEENSQASGHSIASDVGCGRDCLINQEFIKESDILTREKMQLLELHKIVGTTKDSNLNSSLHDTIDNLKTDIETKEHEMKYYKQANPQ